jgi:ribosomal-protein-serine acetyltransferase
MFYCAANEQTELRLIDLQHSAELFQLLEVNRPYLRRWHPWVDVLRAPIDVERAVKIWRQQAAKNCGFYVGIWFKHRFCGVINHLNLDWSNRCTAFTYWLDERHQGQGIMTASCRAMIQHGFHTWKLNRITIECAAENTRSRAIPERLGFKLEGIVRQCEWLHDQYVDHAVYGLLQTEGERPDLSLR